MIESIKVFNPQDYTKEENDIVINISEETNSDYDFNFFYEMSEYSSSPTEIKELGIKPFSWDNHRQPLVKLLRSYRDNPTSKRLVILSEYENMEAMGLAIAISESREFHGKFTLDLLKQADQDFDLNVVISYADIKPQLLDYARVAFKEEVFKLTRYELLEKISYDELLNLTFNVYNKNRKEDLNVKELLDLEPSAEDF